ncbi:MAG: LysM peptidoglycan-binding domain-containing protein [Desulfovibrionales bacterium]
MKIITLCCCVCLLLTVACTPLSRTNQPAADHPAQSPEKVAELPAKVLDPPAESPVPLDEELPPDLEIVEPQVIEETGADPLSPQEETALETEPEIRLDLDVVETKEMEHYFLYFTRKNHNIFQKWLKRAEPYLPYIKAHFKAEGLPEDLIYLPFVESGFNPWAYSRAGAAGMWQFMPYTGKMYGLQVDWWMDERRDPYMATHAAATYLKKLYNDFGDWYLALAAYNAGEGRIARALASSGCDNFFDMVNGKQTLKLETRHYVPKFLAILKIVRNLESLGFEPLTIAEEDEFVMLEVKGGTDLLELAKSCGYTWDEFRKMNAAYRRMVSPPDRTSRIYVPREKLQLAQSYLEKPQSRQAGYFRHKVAGGDSWWRISRKYDVPINILKTMNDRRSNLLRPGEYVLVPGHSTAVASTSVETIRKIAKERSNYVVRKGDTLWAISQATGVSVQTLHKANGLSHARTLQVGQKIYIPSTSTPPTRVATSGSTAPSSDIPLRLVQYQVRNGDTLWDIARKFGVSHKDLQAWNDLHGSAFIRPGDNLKVYVD